MMRSSRVKFCGSDDGEVNRCFTSGRLYHADVSSVGNFLLADDFGEDWLIDSDDEDFEVAV